MAKVRSPNYPTLNLEDAVVRIQKVYTREHRHPADKIVIANALGYGTLNGASLSTISALLKYGFLEPVGDQLRVSAQGEDVCLYGAGEPERLAALREAASRPVLFSELQEIYGDELPSDNNLRAFLIKKGFNPNTVTGAIRSYRETIEFVDAESGDFTADSEEKLDEEIEPPTSSGSSQARQRVKDSSAEFFNLFQQMMDSSNRRAPVLQESDHQREWEPSQSRADFPYSWPLPPGVTADITFRGIEPTSSHITQLIGYLDHFRAALEAQERGAQSAFPPGAPSNYRMPVANVDFDEKE